MKTKILILILSVFVLSCDENDVDRPNPQDNITGTGAFIYNVNPSNGNISMNVFYHIPDAEVANMPILVVFHGAGRNAADIRNAWISEANAKDFIVVAPEFSEENFPGGDGYNLGNVFTDGDNPSPQSLNPESDWAFSIIEPLFDEFKSLSGNNSSTYHVFGFSAGAQFAHRFMMFKPDARFDKIIASAAGWYTVPDDTVDFPYGIANSPLEDTALSEFYSQSLSIQIGTLDNNPNAPALRRNSTVDQQGTNRYDRAFYMFNTSQSDAQNLGLNFNWDIVETPNNGHDMEQSIPQASDLLF